MSKKDFILYIIFGVFFITIYFWSNTLIRSAASWPKMVSVIGLVLSFIGIFRYLFRLIKKNPANSEVYPVINKKIVLRSLFLIIMVNMDSFNKTSRLPVFITYSNKHNCTIFY